MQAASASGDLAVEVVRGKIKADTASGDVTVAIANDSASVSTASGDAAFQFRGAIGAIGQLPILVVDKTAEIELLSKLFVAADGVLKRGRVVGYRALQGCGQIEHHRQQDRDDSCGGADFALAATERADTFCHPPARERD